MTLVPHQIIDLHASLADSVVPWAALVAAVTALAVAWSTRLGQRQDVRRSLYSEAYKAALSWVEMLYRVRRRDPAKQHALVEQFHTLQEQLDYYQGWIESESRSLGRAYRDLVATLKRATAGPIRQAWREDPCDPADGFAIELQDLDDVTAAKDTFIDAARDHLTVFRFWRRIALQRRYTDGAWTPMSPVPRSTETSNDAQKGGSA
jgi:hypothetical protein